MDEINIIQNNSQNDNQSNINPIEPQNYPQKNNDICFLPSRFNAEAPTFFKILLFLVGFLGLQLVAFPVTIFLTFFIIDETLLIALVNFISYVLGFGGIILLLSLFQKGKFFKIAFSGFKKKNTYIWGILLLGLALLVQTIISIISTAILNGLNYNGSYVSQNEQSIEEILSSGYAVLMIVPVVLFAPIIEEFTYRIGLVDSIGKKNRLRGLIFSSLIFGLLHFNGFTILLEILFGPILQEAGISLADGTINDLLRQLLVEVLNLPIYILMGACLGLAYLITGDISASILAHALNNTLSVIISFVSGTASLSYFIPDIFVKLANLSLSPYFNSIMFFINK